MGSWKEGAGHLDSAEEGAWRLDFLSLREEDQGPELLGKVGAGLQVTGEWGTEGVPHRGWGPGCEGETEEQN